MERQVKRYRGYLRAAFIMMYVKIGGEYEKKRKLQKYMIAFILFCGIVSFFGCGTKELPVHQEIYYGSTDVTANSSGVYFWDQEKGKMKFYNFSSGRQVILCNKPQCSHEEEECIANMLPPEGVKGELQAFVADDEHLYCVYVNATEIGLVELGIDGTNRKLLVTFNGVRPTKVWKYEDAVIISYSEAEISEDTKTATSGSGLTGIYFLGQSQWKVMPRGNPEAITLSGIIGAEKGKLYYAYRVIESGGSEKLNSYFGTFNMETQQYEGEETGDISEHYVTGDTVYGLGNDGKSIYQ